MKDLSTSDKLKNASCQLFAAICFRTTVSLLRSTRRDEVRISWYACEVALSEVRGVPAKRILIVYPLLFLDRIGKWLSSHRQVLINKLASLALSQFFVATSPLVALT